MDLSISIVSWNTRDILDQCLRSVFETTREPAFEVIVVDNASSDGTPDMIRHKYPEVRLIENDENVGFARANNQAFAVSTGKHFILLNPDTVIIGDALRKLVEFSDSHDRAGAVGPLVLNDDGSLQYSWARFPTVWSEAVGRLDRSIKGLPRPPSSAGQARSIEPFRADWVGGCCLMIKRKAVDQIGLMDESLFMYCEETDWCLRLHKAEWDVWVNPSAEIVHYGGKSSVQASHECALSLHRSKAMLFSKHYGWLQSRFVEVILALKSGLHRAARRASSSESSVLDAEERLSTLELGCGKKRECPGSVTVDNCEKSSPDVLHDLNVYPYPFSDSSFDLVLCYHVLEHLDNVVRTVEEIHRILKPGGVIKIEAPYFTSVHAYADPTHRHFFTSRSFDYFIQGTEVSRFDYSQARFKARRVELVVPGNGLISRFARKWLNSHLDSYEKQLAFIWPRHTIRYELVAVK